MKKILVLLIIILAGVWFLFLRPQDTGDLIVETKIPEKESPAVKDDSVNLANPASVFCEEEGGELELVTLSSGNQLGICQFGDYACEEWSLYRGECTIEEDQVAIKQALVAKGLDLSMSEVIIHNHLGRDIGGGVVATSGEAGGGYVFAHKSDGGIISIVADGNGSIMCSALAEYPDFSTYLIPECIDDATSQPVKR